MKLHVAGHEVFAATGGPSFDPGHPVVVFVHGAGFDHTTWVLQSRYFAHRGFSVLAVDLPGHGRSGGEPLGSILEMGDWLAALVEAAGVVDAALVGHSMGALASLAAAAHNPLQVSKLALLGISETMPVHPDLLAASKRNDHLAIDLVARWSLGQAARRGGPESSGNRLFDSCVRTLERAAPGVLHADLTACDVFDGAVELANRVQCPTLFVLGAADKMTPVRSTPALIQAIGDSGVEVLPGAGHMMMSERSQETNVALERFLWGERTKEHVR